MKILKRTIFICIILLCLRHSSYAKKNKVLKILGGINKFVSVTKFIQDLVSDESAQRAKILETISALQEQITEFQANTLSKLDMITSLIQLIPDENSIRDARTRIRRFVADINNQWKEFTSRIITTRDHEAIDDFTYTIYSNLRSSLSAFREDLVATVWMGAVDKGLFLLIAEHATAQRDTLCGEGETYYTGLQRIFQIVVVTEIKALLLQSFTYFWRWSEEEATRHHNAEVEDFKRYLKSYINAFSNSLMGKERPYLRACDPKTGWSRDNNFIELYGFRQQSIYKGYRPTYSDDRKSVTIYPLSEELTCESTGECKEIPFQHSNIVVCSCGLEPYRIRFITFQGKTQGTDLSNPGFCYWKRRTELAWYDADRAYSCQCQSNRWIIIARLLQSNIDENYVIVGMRFRRFEDRILIDIAEGKLGSNGDISDVSWDRATRRKSKDEGSYVRVEQNRRAFFFTDLQLPPGYVLTGVQMIATSRNGINGFTLRIHGVSFDYSSGQLEKSKEVLIDPPRPPGEIELTFPRKGSQYSSVSDVHHTPKSQGYTYLNLEQSEMDYDFGQSTLPLIETIPIMTSPLEPMGGVGLFFKGHWKYSGFLALRTFPIDYLPFLKDLEDYANNRLAVE